MRAPHGTRRLVAVFLSARHQFFSAANETHGVSEAHERTVLFRQAYARLEMRGRAWAWPASHNDFSYFAEPARHRLTSVCPLCVRPHAKLQAARTACRN